MQTILLLILFLSIPTLLLFAVLNKYANKTRTKTDDNSSFIDRFINRFKPSAPNNQSLKLTREDYRNKAYLRLLVFNSRKKYCKVPTQAKINNSIINN